MAELNPDPTIQIVLDALYQNPKWTGLTQGIEAIYKRNPYVNPEQEDASVMWKEQAGLNFPLLYLASLYLYIYAKKRGYETFLFATRDCCHWVRIFKVMFPTTKAHYFQCSRNMFGKGFRETHLSFYNYVKSLVLEDSEDLSSTTGHDLNQAMKKTLYVDIHGTGQHVFNYFRKNFEVIPGCFLLSSSCPNYRAFPNVARKHIHDHRLINLVFDCHGGPIEMLNYDLVGTLQDFSVEGQPIRDPPEYDLTIIRPYHRCIDLVVKHLIAPDPLKYNLDELLEIIKLIFKLITSKHIIARKYIHHIGRHKKTKID